MKKKAFAAALMLAVAVLLFILFIPRPEPLSPPDIEKHGISIDVDKLYGKFGEDIYNTKKPLEKLPHTFEAWVYLTPTEQGHGVIYGNYDGHTDYYLNFAVKNGVPMIYWQDGDQNSYQAVFTEVNVCTGEFAHIAIVKQEEKGSVQCYLNGKLSQTLEGFADFSPDIIKPLFSAGGDNRKLNTQYFKGKLHSVTLFEDARSGKQIKEDMQKVNVKDKALICHYLFDRAKADISDLSPNENHLEYCCLWPEPEQTEQKRDPDFSRAYSFAVVADTQFMAKDNPEKLTTLYSWIGDNAQQKNIQYVLGVGDITDSDTEDQWQTVKKALATLEGRVDYSLVRGNHDLKNGGELFNQSFKNTSFAERFTPFDEGDYSNSYAVKQIGKTKYLFLNLDYSPAEKELVRAGEILSEYQDCTAVIITHAYLHSDGSRLETGEQLWQKLIKKHANIKLVLCGHVSSNQVIVSQAEGDKGNTVTQILVDGQDYDKYLSGLGMVAMLYFNEAGDKMEVEYYSTVLDRIYRTSNVFTIDLK